MSKDSKSFQNIIPFRAQAWKILISKFHVTREISRCLEIRKLALFCPSAYETTMKRRETKIRLTSCLLFYEFKSIALVIWKLRLSANCYLKDSVGNFKPVVFTSLDLRSEDWDFKTWSSYYNVYEPIKLPRKLSLSQTRNINGYQWHAGITLEQNHSPPAAWNSNTLSG